MRFNDFLFIQNCILCHVHFFLTSHSIGWGMRPDNWVDFFVLRFKTGLFFDISVVSLLGIAISWYFLRYFK